MALSNPRWTQPSYLADDTASDAAAAITVIGCARSEPEHDALRACVGRFHRAAVERRTSDRIETGASVTQRRAAHEHARRQAGADACWS